MLNQEITGMFPFVSYNAIYQFFKHLLWKKEEIVANLNDDIWSLFLLEIILESIKCIWVSSGRAPV